MEDEKFKLKAAAANRQTHLAESKNMIEFLQMEKDSHAWDETDMREMLTKARDRIFGASKEKEPKLANDASSSDNLEIDIENLYS